MIGDPISYTFGERDQSAISLGAPYDPAGGRRGGLLPLAGEETRGWIVRENADGTANLSLLCDSNLNVYVPNAREGSGPGQYQAVS